MCTVKERNYLGGLVKTCIVYTELSRSNFFSLIRKNVWRVRSRRLWNKLPLREMVAAQFLAVFENQLDTAVEKNILGNDPRTKWLNKPFFISNSSSLSQSHMRICSTALTSFQHSYTIKISTLCYFMESVNSVMALLGQIKCFSSQARWLVTFIHTSILIKVYVSNKLL